MKRTKPEPVFHDNVAIITGAASGIGRELAFQMAGQGALLSLADLRADLLAEVAERCRAYGGQAIALSADVTIQGDCLRLVASTVEEYGCLDTLVNNAGITTWGNFEDLEDFSTFEQVMQVNFWGSVFVTHYALPHLKRSRGRIVAVSSLAGKAGLPTRTAYSASKHALVGFFDALRLELVEDGVSVTLVYPGFVATQLRQNAVGSPADRSGKGPVDEGKAMSPEDCARRILQAMARRKREEVMTARGKVGQWIKLIAPGVVDRQAIRAVERGS